MTAMILSADVRAERIAYEVTTEEGSSGSPVFVTIGDDPIVVAIHCEAGKGSKYYGSFLGPFLRATGF